MRATLWSVILALAALSVSGVWSSSDAQSPAAAPEACSLATKAEIEQHTGTTIRSDPEPSSLAGGSGSACTYGGGEAQIVVFSGPKSEESWDRFVKSFGHDKAARHPVPEAGEGAYIIFPKPKSKYQDAIGLVVVKVGPHTMGISMAAPKGEPAESVQPRVVMLTKAVVAKLEG